MIQVKRTNHEAHTFRGQYIEAFHECRYFYEGKEIASYNSRYDTFRVRSEYIGRDRAKTAYENALSGDYKEAYEYLFGMLGIDETTRIGEYMYA